MYYFTKLHEDRAKLLVSKQIVLPLDYYGNTILDKQYLNIKNVEIIQK